MRWIVLAALAGCAGVQQRLPDDVLASVAHDPMRRPRPIGSSCITQLARRLVDDQALTQLVAISPDL